MMKTFFAFVLLAVFSFVPDRASAWEFKIIEGSGAGTLNACSAIKHFKDAFVSIRLYGEEMDFIFQVDEFALPPDEALGFLEVSVDDESFLGLAFSLSADRQKGLATASAIQIMIGSDSYGPLFDLLRNGNMLKLAFPSGDNYQVSLQGSARALSRASDCWTRYETGPDSKNPFAVPQGSNPFSGARPSEPEPEPPPASNPFEQAA